MGTKRRRRQIADGHADDGESRQSRGKNRSRIRLAKRPSNHRWHFWLLNFSRITKDRGLTG